MVSLQHLSNNVSADGSRCPVHAAISGERATFDFLPQSVGDCQVKVMNGADEIGQSPYAVSF